MNRRRAQKLSTRSTRPRSRAGSSSSTFLAATGLSYVYLTVQLHHQGVQRSALEQELAATRTQNEDARVQIAALTSRTALQRRLKEGYLKMIPITEQSIVRLNSSARADR